MLAMSMTSFVAMELPQSSILSAFWNPAPCNFKMFLLNSVIVKESRQGFLTLEFSRIKALRVVAYVTSDLRRSSPSFSASYLGHLSGKQRRRARPSQPI